MASTGEDSEVACYVLGMSLPCCLFQKMVTSLLVAYLLRENYSETANAFLKECRVLPTGTLLV